MNDPVRSPRQTPAERLRQSLRDRPDLAWALVVTLTYAVVTVTLTWPLIRHLSSAIVGRGITDGYEYIWLLWRTKHAIFGPGRGLAHLAWVNHPAGLYQPFVLTMLTLNLTALPLSVILSPTLVYNLLALTSFVLCGLTTYLFVNEMVEQRWAAFVGGLVFAFFTNKTGHLLAGHLPLIVAYWTPLVLLLVWRLVKEPGLGKAVTCGLTLAAALLVHPIHVVYFLVPAVGAVLVYLAAELKRDFFKQERRRALLLAGGVAAILAIPALLPTVFFQQAEGSLEAGGTVDYSGDLLAVVTPSPYHPLLRHLSLLPDVARDVFPDKRALEEGLAYPGIGVLALSGWALVRRRHKSWIWGTLAAVCLVLSWGPLLKVGGEIVARSVEGYQGHVVLPYALLDRLPLFGLSRTPNRLSETVTFALAVLAGIGFADVSSRLRSGWSVALSAAAVAALMLFESLVLWPMPLSDTGVSPAVEAVAREPGNGALLYLPAVDVKALNHGALRDQTVCERPIVGGRVFRHLPATEPWEITLAGLAAGETPSLDIVPRPTASARRRWLRHFDVDFVLVSKNHGQDREARRQAIEQLVGPSRFEDDEWAVFQVPEGQGGVGSGLLYSLPDDWSPPKADEQGRMWRSWRGEGGTIYVYAAEQTEGRIQFKSKSTVDLAEVELEVDERSLGIFAIDSAAAFGSDPVTWEPGMHEIRLESETACQDQASDYCQELAVTGVEFVPHGRAADLEGSDINLDNLVQLRRFDIKPSTISPGDSVTVTLTWRSLAPIDGDLVAFAHIINEQEELTAQHDAPPGGDRLPTSKWHEDLFLIQRLPVQVPEQAQPGEYTVLVGLYRWPGLDRLRVLSDVPGAEIRAVELGTVKVR